MVVGADHGTDVIDAGGLDINWIFFRMRTYPIFVGCRILLSTVRHPCIAYLLQAGLQPAWTRSLQKLQRLPPLPTIRTWPVSTGDYHPGFRPQLLDILQLS